MTSALLVASLGLIALSGLLFVARIVTTTSLADRMVALDALLLAIVSGIAVQGARTGDTTYHAAMVVTALLAFVGTALVARFIARRGQ